MAPIALEEPKSQTQKEQAIKANKIIVTGKSWLTGFK
jgi:hypothetical protein